MSLSCLIRIPIPPSVNHLFGAKVTNGRGIIQTIKRYKTADYRAWLEDAGWGIRIQNPPHFDGPIKILIEVERKNKHSDIDNRLKATLDLMVAMHVIKDDALVEEVTIRWADVSECEITITALEVTGASLRKAG